MHRRFGRLAALLGAGALALAISAPAFAAEPAKLTAVVAVDSTDAPPAGKAWVRVLHGSPDAPAVDVKVNDANVLTNVAFGVISDYLPVDAGTYNIKVCAAGTDTCVIDADLTFADGKKYTVAATDLLASIQAQVLEDSATANAEQAQARVVHFSADTPAVDVLTQDGSAKVVDEPDLPRRHRLPRPRRRLVRPQGLRRGRQHRLPARSGRPRPRRRHRLQRVRRRLPRRDDGSRRFAGRLPHPAPDRHGRR